LFAFGLYSIQLFLFLFTCPNRIETIKHEGRASNQTT